MQKRTKAHHELYDAICAIVGKKYVVDDEFELIPYAQDISYFHGVMPGIAVRPGCTEEIADIVKLAWEAWPPTNRTTAAPRTAPALTPMISGLAIGFRVTRCRA